MDAQRHRDRGQSASTLDLAGIAEPGDIIRVTVLPSDGTTPGHAASDEVVVGREVVLPSAPTITATATTSRRRVHRGRVEHLAVTVAFACTAGAPLFSACPAPRTVTADTGAAGTLVTGSITDLLGRVATTSVLVRVDATAPELSPVVTPADGRGRRRRDRDAARDGCRLGRRLGVLRRSADGDGGRGIRHLPGDRRRRQHRHGVRVLHGRREGDDQPRPQPLTPTPNPDPNP